MFWLRVLHEVVLQVLSRVASSEGLAKAEGSASKHTYVNVSGRPQFLATLDSQGCSQYKAASSPRVRDEREDEQETVQPRWKPQSFMN